MWLRCRQRLSEARKVVAPLVEVAILFSSRPIKWGEGLRSGRHHTSAMSYPHIKCVKGRESGFKRGTSKDIYSIEHVTARRAHGAWSGGRRTRAVACTEHFLVSICRASELCPCSNEQVHKGFALMRRGVTFFSGSANSSVPTMCPCADRVRFQARIWKEDLERKRVDRIRIARHVTATTVELGVHRKVC